MVDGTTSTAVTMLKCNGPTLRIVPSPADHTEFSCWMDNVISPRHTPNERPLTPRHPFLGRFGSPAGPRRREPVNSSSAHDEFACEGSLQRCCLFASHSGHQAGNGEDQTRIKSLLAKYRRPPQHCASIWQISQTLVTLTPASGAR